MGHVLNPSTPEAEAGPISEFRTTVVYTDFQDSQGYGEKPCLRTLPYPRKGSGDSQEVAERTLFFFPLLPGFLSQPIRAQPQHYTHSSLLGQSRPVRDSEERHRMLKQPGAPHWVTDTLTGLLKPQSQPFQLDFSQYFFF